MKTLKTSTLFSFLFVCGMNVSTDNKNNLIYNPEKISGTKVAGTVYKVDGSTFANYMKYNYKYNDQNRMTESETTKWNAVKNTQTGDMCIRYTYQGESVIITYYKWSNKKGTYVLAPGVTITMDSPSIQNTFILS